MGEIEHKGVIEINVSEVELQQMFDTFISQNCSPYAPVDSSDRMKTALYKFFNQKYKIDKYDPKAQRLVLGKENVQVFVDAINLAKEKYQQEVVKQLSEKRELQEVPKWEIPVIVTYNSRYAKDDKPLSILKPYYTKKPSEPERQFIELLENSGKVKWWFKNGESEIKYFAVLYKDEIGMERGFYVDSIVQFKDGTIGLFDTKSGMTAKDAGARAAGLVKYIKTESKKGKKLWGGIAIYVNGSWRYNDEETYTYDDTDLSKWKLLRI